MPTRRAVARAAALVWGCSTAVVVASDGSAIWIGVRLVVVALVTTGLVVAITSDRFATISAISAGAVGVLIGLGVGVSHAVRSGEALLALSGLASLASGLVLLVDGSAKALQRFGTWGRVGGAVAIALGIGVVQLTFVPALMATNVPPTSLGSSTPATYGLTYEEVEFDTTDGVTVSAWYIPSTNGAAVVLRHGAGSTRSSVLEHAVVLARHGYGVVLTDARGHGRSGGRAMDFGWYGDEDTAAAVSFLSASDEVDPTRIGAIGMSMGGEEVIGAALADRRIAAVVAEGATGRTDADKAWLSDEYGVRGRVQIVIEWLRFSLADLLTSADRPTGLAAAIDGAGATPFLLIAGATMDDEVSVAERLREVSPDTVAVWVVPGAGHTRGLDDAPAEWERRVVAFLDASIGP